MYADFLTVSIKTEHHYVCKSEFMAEMLDWIALQFTGVPSKLCKLCE